MDISVIICCYNSTNRITPTLEHISKQLLNGISCEVLLINNNCTDNTVDVAQDVWAKFNNPFLLKVIEENKPGLSNARKAGVLAASGEIIIFCDDDNWLDKNYLYNAFEIMKVNSKIGVLGGQSRAVSDIEIPIWFYSYYQYYACGVLSLESGDITHRTWIWGAGMVLRKKLLLTLYSCFNHLTTDRTGNDFSSGGDVEICYWNILAGYKLWYSENLNLDHFMPPSRLEKNLAIRQINAQRKSAELLRHTHQLVEYYIQFNQRKSFTISLILQLSRLNFGKVFITLKYFLILSNLIPNKTMRSINSFKRKLVNT